MQPNHYINTVLVPRDGEIPVDIDNLAAQGIFDVVCLLNSFIMCYWPDGISSIHDKDIFQDCLFEIYCGQVHAWIWHFVLRISVNLLLI